MNHATTEQHEADRRDFDQRVEAARERRERFGPPVYVPAIHGEQLSDELGRAAIECQAFADAIVANPKAKARWERHAFVIQCAAEEVRYRS